MVARLSRSQKIVIFAIGKLFFEYFALYGSFSSLEHQLKPCIDRSTSAFADMAFAS